MKIGFMELVVIFIVALLAIGPDKLPAYAQKLGQALREFRKVSQDVTQDVRESVIEPLEEAQKPLREALEKEFKNIGKPKPPEKTPAVPAEAAEPETEEEQPAGPEEPAEENTEQCEGEDL